MSSITRNRASVLRMRSPMSAACLAMMALVSAFEKWSSGTLDGSRWGPAISPARGIATWACMSTVVLFGRDCLPGVPRLRAAVGSYLFQMSAMARLSLVLNSEDAEMLRNDGVVKLERFRLALNTTAPVLMITTSSARSSTSLMFCSTSTIDCPSVLSWAMMRPTSATICGARPSDGSSIRSTRGLPISARPIASICCSPPDSEPATWA